MLGNRNSAIEHRESREGGFAILMVVLVLVCLAIIGAPFAISMRQEEQASITFSARVRAKLAAQAALSFAIAQLEETHEDYERRYAEGGQSTMHNSPYVDSNGEFRVDLQDPLLNGVETANPAGVMWGVQVTDEQGKINLKTASQALLANLVFVLFGTTGQEKAAKTLAKGITDYRDEDRHQLTTVSQLREVPGLLGKGFQTGGGLSLTEFDRLTSFLTVRSASFVGEVPSRSLALHPININTCSEEVLRALLLGLKLKKQDGDTTDPVAVSPAEVDALVHRLRVMPPSLVLGGIVKKNDTKVPIIVDPEFKLPGSGWISIEGDAVKYFNFKNGDLGLSVTLSNGKSNDTNDPTPPVAAAVDEDHPRKDTPPDQAEVRLLFTDVENDLPGILNDMVNNTKELTAASCSAILANAINPLNGAALDLTTTTAPFTFRSFNIYTIEAHGVANAPDGRELARYTVREVAQVAPLGNLEIKIDTQEDFERSRQSGLSYHVATWPNPTQAGDVGPAGCEDPDPQYVYKHGRVGLQKVEHDPLHEPRFALHFASPLVRDVLRADTALMPDYAKNLTTVKCLPEDHSDLAPDGVHIATGTKMVDGTPTTENRTLVYPARIDPPVKDPKDPTKVLDQDNIAYDRVLGDIQPFSIGMWVKLDAGFDFNADHFLFDFGHETYSNRVALYYHTRGSDSGDLVLHVCDSTLQNLAAQVRCRITKAATCPSDVTPDQWCQFEPERWYQIKAVIKGLNYNYLALFINGRSVGRFLPSARVSADAGATIATTPAKGLDNDGPTGDVFRSLPWPSPGAALLGGEIVEYGDASDGTKFSTCLRARRNTLQASHPEGTRAEVFGYQTFVQQSWGDTTHTLPYLVTSKEDPQPTLVARNFPAQFQIVTVDDYDEKNPTGVPDPITPITKDGTTQYATDYAKSYTAALGAVPTDGWLPICASDQWIVDPQEKDPNRKQKTLDDLPDYFASVVKRTPPDPTKPDLASMLVWTDQTPTTSTREITDTTDGLGFFRLVKNPQDAPKDRLAFKFSKAGAVLVWRYHPADEVDPTLVGQQSKWRKIAWYIGYIGGFDKIDALGTVTKGSFTGTTIKEGDQIQLDCIRFATAGDNQTKVLARGKRGEVTTKYDKPGGGEYVITKTTYGQGIFEIGAGTSFEWIRFNFPELDLTAKSDEVTLLAGKWLVGLDRNVGGTGLAADLPTGTASIGPVFFAGEDLFSDRAGANDQVTLTDSDGQREAKGLKHVSGPYFSFSASVDATFYYGKYPRLLKFPCSLPIRPDKFFYIGSDTTCVDGTAPKFSDGPGAAEPERPANATFDEIQIRTLYLGNARLWDAKPAASGGAPDMNVGDRGKNPIAAVTATGTACDPPFYIRVGDLETFHRDPKVSQFRYLSSGTVDGWPLEGYIKVDDECMYYRMVYRRPADASLPSASVKPTNTTVETDPATGQPTGYIIILAKGATEINLESEDAVKFPTQGYLTFNTTLAGKSYWGEVGTTRDGLVNGEVAKDPKRYEDPDVLAKLRQDTLKKILDDIQAGKLPRDAAGNVLSESATATQEYMFFTRDGTKLTVVRGCLESQDQDIKFWDDKNSSWFLGGTADLNQARVQLVSVQLLILDRACLGTARDIHVPGAVVMPLENVSSALVPRPMVRLQRDSQGKLVLDGGKIKALKDDDTSFDITQSQYEYGIVLEDSSNYKNFPAEGYVQIGKEILGYVQDRAGSSPIWTATVTAKDGSTQDMPVLTGFKRFRRRYGTPQETYLSPTADVKVALSVVDPTADVPTYYDTTSGPAARRVVRLLDVRYHDRFPIRTDEDTPTWDPSSESTGGYSPHYADADLAYYEVAVSMPGARWTSVHWAEALYRQSGSNWVLDNTPLSASDPFEVRVLAQIDGTPGWNDMTPDPAVLIKTVKQPVSSPVYWLDFPNRDDAYNKDAQSHRPLKPVIYLFDQANDPGTVAQDQPGNYINGPRRDGKLGAQGQSGDRMRLRVLFQYKKNTPSSTTDPVVPFYQIPWRTPWVDWITIGYSAPTTVMEYREMPY